MTRFEIFTEASDIFGKIIEAHEMEVMESGYLVFKENNQVICAVAASVWTSCNRLEDSEESETE